MAAYIDNYTILGAEVITQAVKDFKASYKTIVKKYYDFQSEGFKAPLLSDFQKNEDIKKENAYRMIVETSKFFCSERIELFSCGEVSMECGPKNISDMIKMSVYELLNGKRTKRVLIKKGRNSRAVG